MASQKSNTQRAIGAELAPPKPEFSTTRASAICGLSGQHVDIPQRDRCFFQWLIEPAQHVKQGHVGVFRNGVVGTDQRVRDVHDLAAFDRQVQATDERSVTP